MRRREFITLLGSAAAAWPLAARAQQSERAKRVGVLMNSTATDATWQSYFAAFVQGLRQLGWIEGQNLRIDIRWSAGDAALARIYAAQLIGLTPDVILASSTTNLTVVQQATSTVPVVFIQVSDPVAQGFVANVTRPGGNLTGFSMYEFAIGNKWLDLLKEIAPKLARVGVMFNPDTSPQSKFFMRLSQTLIAELASRHRLPAVSADGDFARNGGLMYYGATINLLDQFRQAANYVDRILKGAKPGDLPIQRADKYTLVINLKVAKSLGLTVPLPLAGLADELIE